MNRIGSLMIACLVLSLAYGVAAQGKDAGAPADVAFAAPSTEGAGRHAASSRYS